MVQWCCIGIESDGMLLILFLHHAYQINHIVICSSRYAVQALISFFVLVFALGFSNRVVRWPRFIDLLGGTNFDGVIYQIPI
jgi:hypothetical protein